MTLKAVLSELPPPPYLKNTRVKGWRFTLDYERINQSDTWALAPSDMRPWLLMLWHTAWQQTPAGSLSDNDQVIAAKIGMDHRIFVAHRDILMRGWARHSDGRLYHPVITEQVLGYLENSRRERIRKSEYRAKQKQELTTNVPRDTHGTPVGVRTPEPEPEKNLPLAQSEVGKEVGSGSSNFAELEQFCAGGEPW